jgi:hypothetical protein
LANLANIIDYVYPTVSGVGILTTNQIWVIFDREIDETTLSAGNLFVTGLDSDTWSGPDLQIFLDRDSTTDNDILQSPGFDGLVQGTITFDRIALDSLTSVSTEDVVGSGHLYRSKAIFTPTNKLQVNTEYSVYLSGDEDDTDLLKTGISARTVFDCVASGANLGTGTVSFTGGYIGSVAEDTYRVEITTSGEVGTSRFRFSRDSDPLTYYGPFRTKRSGVLLSDGVTVSFSEGVYAYQDQWSTVVKEREVFTGNVTWPFKTGSGSVETLPLTVATSIIGDPTTTTSTTSTTFSVSSTYPEDETSHLTILPGDFNITATFNKDIDSSSVVSGVAISVYSESVTGETDIPASGVLSISHSVSGSELTITVASGQLMQNNLVTVTLDSSITATDGTTLDDDYEFWFTTAYYPMYCTLRMTKVRVGAFINELKDDTVNLALFMASKESDYLTWNKSNLEDDYYKFVRGQWTCCRATQLLLTNVAGGAGSIKSKRLGDLSVDYDTALGIAKPLQLAEECLQKWEGALMAGGRQVQESQMVVKGDLDVDKPPIGRGWAYTRDLHNSQMPAANRRINIGGSSRRFRNIFTRAAFPKGWWSR